MEIYGLEDMGKECGVHGGTVLAYIKYCVMYNIDVPAPIPYAKFKYADYKSEYVYKKDDALIIIEMFKNKKRGEMSEYNYINNYGKAFREKYPKQ